MITQGWVGGCVVGDVTSKAKRGFRDVAVAVEDVSSASGTSEAERSLDVAMALGSKHSTCVALGAVAFCYECAGLFERSMACSPSDP